MTGHSISLEDTLLEIGKLRRDAEVWPFGRESRDVWFKFKIRLTSLQLQLAFLALVPIGLWRRRLPPLNLVLPQGRFMRFDGRSFPITRKNRLNTLPTMIGRDFATSIAWGFLTAVDLDVIPCTFLIAPCLKNSSHLDARALKAMAGCLVKRPMSA
jgi:hypothetical protein